MWVLECDSYAELDSAHGTSVLGGDDVRDFPCRAILTINAIIGFTQIRVVEKVEEIGSELNLQALRDREALRR